MSNKIVMAVEWYTQEKINIEQIMAQIEFNSPLYNDYKQRLNNIDKEIRILVFN